MGGADYSQAQVNKWTAAVVERCLSQLLKQAKAYKYIGRRRRPPEVLGPTLPPRLTSLSPPPTQ